MKLYRYIASKLLFWFFVIRIRYAFWSMYRAIKVVAQMPPEQAAPILTHWKFQLAKYPEEYGGEKLYEMVQKLEKHIQEHNQGNPPVRRTNIIGLIILVLFFSSLVACVLSLAHMLRHLILH